MSTPTIKIISLHPQYTTTKTLQGAQLHLRGFRVKYEILIVGSTFTGECEWNKHPVDIKEVTEHVKRLIQQLK